jgi:AAA15 family ATPase/GTPase
MLSALTIQNFRGFESAEVENFANINLIVGTNGSGKSALLEGIYLASAASPQAASQINGLRGLQLALPPYPSQEQFDSIWTYLFRNQDSQKPILLSLVTGSGAPDPRARDREDREM